MEIFCQSSEPTIVRRGQMNATPSSPKDSINQQQAKDHSKGDMKAPQCDSWKTSGQEINALTGNPKSHHQKGHNPMQNNCFFIVSMQKMF